MKGHLKFANNAQLIIINNKQLNEIPSSRDDMFIETPAIGRIKVSIVANNIKNSNMKVISFYVVPECMLTDNANVLKISRIISKSPVFR